MAALQAAVRDASKYTAGERERFYGVIADWLRAGLWGTFYEIDEWLPDYYKGKKRRAVA